MPSDQELMHGVQRADEAAFDALLSRYGGTVRRRAECLLFDRAAAEDVTQEVFLRLWTRADTFAGGSIRAWLLRVATNLALNARRSRRRRRTVDHGPDPGRASAPASSGPGRRMERAERRSVLRQAVAGLPAAKRRVVRLVHEEQMELHRVADELGIPLGTVKSRLHYALRDLARTLREYGWEGTDEP